MSWSTGFFEFQSRFYTDPRQDSKINSVEALSATEFMERTVFRICAD